jgi:hypothetical protein
MNAKEKTKIEIRFYKRFFDELEQAIVVPTTYENLKAIATRYEVPLHVLDILVMSGFLCGVNNDQDNVFEPQQGKDELPYYFFFTDEPDYKVADDLRMIIHQHSENFTHVSSGEQKHLVDELEADDDFRSRVGSFLKNEHEEIITEKHSSNERQTDKRKVIEIKVPEWLEKFLEGILK